MPKITIEKNNNNFDNFINKFNDTGKTNIVEASELGDSLKELNNDATEEKTKMSGIDLRTRLAFTEVSSILAIDTLVSFNFIPERCLTFTRQKKRLAVSLGGKGRAEIVEIVGGKKEQDNKRGFFGNLFQGKKE